MNDTSLTNSPIETQYRAMTPRSRKLASEAAELLPSGIAHDSRHMSPYGIYTDHAQGAQKWDVDSNEYVDYYGGHGALLLGHRHPEVMAAVEAQLGQGTHYGTCHALELEWAKLVCELVPCAERVRFHSSGTEATHMALRLARAFTGRERVIRFQGHFHGWHDAVAFGVDSHFDGSPTPGVIRSVADGVVLVPPNDVVALETALSGEDIAAAIIEPIGSNSGKLPVGPEFLSALRALTAKYGTLLIFDEVVTGFRLSPGGAQARFGVMPDLTTLAKIVAGGLPGGALCGRKDVLDWLDFEVSEGIGREKVRHQGTFNANPVSAAAGIATLQIVRDTDACERADGAAQALRQAMNEALTDAGVPWSVYGDYSILHFFTNPDGAAIDPCTFDANSASPECFGTDPRKRMLEKLRLAMLVKGVDLKGWRGAIVSAQHDDALIARTVSAWRETLALLKREGEIG